MPIISPSQYHPPLFYGNGHLQTILPALLRRVDGVHYRRERIDTPDGDFLDLDWSQVGARRLVVLSHGLEGSADRSYIRGMARALNDHGWDVLAWNYRGCSGEPNRTLRFYHSGATDDLDLVIQHLLARDQWDEIALIGFSLGGNLTLKYMGEYEGSLDRRITRAVAFSVPCDLRSSAFKLARPANALYMRRFIRTLTAKVREKMIRMPGELEDRGLATMRTFLEFDDRYTAPLHGFRDAEDYWARSSSRRYLDAIRRPTLLVNAANDPFLAPECFPLREAERSRYLYLEIPGTGGHVGFPPRTPGYYWMEERALRFLSDDPPLAR